MIYSHIYFGANEFDSLMLLSTLSIGFGVFKNQLLTGYLKLCSYFKSVDQSNYQLAYSEFKKLAFPSQIPLIERGVSLEDTMTKGTGEACIMRLSFDTPIHLSDHYESFMGAVENDIIRAIKDHHLQEELGLQARLIDDSDEGFLVSIGFPYHSNKKAGRVILPTS